MSLITASPWYERALAGAPEPIRDGQPQEGFFACKLGRNGALAPARIWSDGGRFYCVIAGEARDPIQEWPFLSKRPIAAATYAVMLRNLKDNFASPKEARKAKLHELKPPKW